MKNTLLLFLSLSIGLFAFGQSAGKDFKMLSAKAPSHFVEPETTTTVSNPGILPVVTPPVSAPKNANVVTQIAIGTSVNAFGFFADARTASIGLNNSLNTVAFTHRLAAPASGNHLGYDVSFNKGATWQLNQISYTPGTGFASARYPLGGIYNPPGNTNPQNAYHTYFSAALDGSQGVAASWGGAVYGAKKFAAGSTQAQAAYASSANQKWFIPGAFTVTQQGVAWFVDESTNWDGTTSTYTGTLTIGKGTFDAGIGNYVYELTQLPFEINSARGINDVEIAFAPDGQVGYISILSSLPVELPFTSYHPILLKTVDGGQTWSTPIEVQLGGANGLPEVQAYISDAALAAYFSPDPVPPRNQIAYYMGYYHDLAVDAWGNPHLAGHILLSNLSAGTIATGTGYGAIFHIYSPNRGLTWKSKMLAPAKFFKADFTGGGSTVSQYSRSQVATTTDGTIVFFSWLDSEMPDATDMSRPDIYFRDFIPYQGAAGTYGDAVNVTLFSAAMWTANWGTMPNYVFTSNVGTNSVECTIPFIYQKLNAENNPTALVQFFYIPDFKKTYVKTSTPEIDNNLIASISQNYPNPFVNETNINVTLVKNAEVILDVFNLTGQKVYSRNYGTLQSGSNTLKVKSDNLTTGVYFYTVEAGASKVTRKMVVK